MADQFDQLRELWGDRKVGSWVTSDVVEVCFGAHRQAGASREVLA